jgi:hypothetical protein
VRIRFDLSLVSTGFGVFAGAAGVAHVCVFLGSGLRKFLPSPDLLIPTIELRPETWHIILWCAVSGLCAAAAVLWARRWLGRVDARDWARNLAVQDRPEPSVR